MKATRRGFLGAIGALAAGYALDKSGLLVPERRIFQVPANAPVRGHAYLGMDESVGTDSTVILGRDYSQTEEALCERHFQEKVGAAISRGPLVLKHDYVTGEWSLSASGEEVMRGDGPGSPPPPPNLIDGLNAIASNGREQMERRFAKLQESMRSGVPYEEAESVMLGEPFEPFVMPEKIRVVELRITAGVDTWFMSQG